MVVGMQKMTFIARDWCHECPSPLSRVYFFFLPIGHALMDMHTPLDGARNSRLGLWRLRVFKIEFEVCGRSFSEFWRKEIGKKKYFDARMLAGEN